MTRRARLTGRANNADEPAESACETRQVAGSSSFEELLSVRGTRRSPNQTGGGEVLAQVTEPPELLVATESWPLNIEVAREKLKTAGRLGGRGARCRRPTVPD